MGEIRQEKWVSIGGNTRMFLEACVGKCGFSVQG